MEITSLPHSAIIKCVLFPFGIDSGHLGEIIENKKDFKRFFLSPYSIRTDTKQTS